MLALSRKEKESIILTVPPSAEPTEIEIVFVGWRAPKARLGFKAPQRVAILRSELVKGQGGVSVTEREVRVEG